MTVPSEFSEELVDKLLDKLSSDNEFRAVFLKNPRIALAYLGHEAAINANVGDKGAWSCLQCKELASPEIIRDTRNKLRLDLLTSSAGLSPITLDIVSKKA